MNIYFRILINKETLEIEHCVTSPAPLFDVKTIETYKVDEVTGEAKDEVLYDEWNGVLESDVNIRAKDLREVMLEQYVTSLDVEPTFKSEHADMRSKVITTQKNIKQRFPKDLSNVFHLDLTKIQNKDKADEILVEEFEHEIGRKRLDGEDVTKLDDKIKLVRAQRNTGKITVET